MEKATLEKLGKAAYFGFAEALNEGLAGSSDYDKLSAGAKSWWESAAKGVVDTLNSDYNSALMELMQATVTSPACMACIAREVTESVCEFRQAYHNLKVLLDQETSRNA